MRQQNQVGFQGEFAQIQTNRMNVSCCIVFRSWHAIPPLNGRKRSLSFRRQARGKSAMEQLKYCNRELSVRLRTQFKLGHSRFRNRPLRVETGQYPHLVTGRIRPLAQAKQAIKNLCYAVPGIGDCSVIHRTVDYDVQEVEPGLWRWNIFPGNRTVQGRPQFRTRELAVEACLLEINDGIERTRRAAR
jgi:hypothetical protein